MTDERPVRRVLTVTAHPDDVDFGSAGTIASLTDAGVEVGYCLVTNGDAGGFDPSVPRSEIASIRQREQTAAAKVVGVDHLVFLGYPDGAVQPTLQLRKDISREIRRFKPDVVITQNPNWDFNRIYGSHPDHRYTGEATLCAVYPDARNPFTFTDLLDEGFEPHSAWQVWIAGGPKPTKFVDTTQQFDRKIEALLCHESQHQNPDGMKARVRAWNEELARVGGLPEGHTAEAYLVVETA
jgi:LmbE family N-acetylglucosaminyl deacetylase